MSGKVEIRDARASDANIIHGILADAFLPYKDKYTEEAYENTVCPPHEIAERIDDALFDVLVAQLEDEIIGTVTLNQRSRESAYLSSMAVKPTAQGKAVGCLLLIEAERRARNRKCIFVSLECCEFLKMAIGLYRRMGYKRTGTSRPYYGVEVFEMKKRL